MITVLHYQGDSVSGLSGFPVVLARLRVEVAAHTQTGRRREASPEQPVELGLTGKSAIVVDWSVTGSTVQVDGGLVTGLMPPPAPSLRGVLATIVRRMDDGGPIP